MMPTLHPMPTTSARTCSAGARTRTHTTTCWRRTKTMAAAIITFMVALTHQRSTLTPLLTFSVAVCLQAPDAPRQTQSIFIHPPMWMMAHVSTRLRAARCRLPSTMTRTPMQCGRARASSPSKAVRIALRPTTCRKLMCSVRIAACIVCLDACHQ